MEKLSLADIIAALAQSEFPDEWEKGPRVGGEFRVWRYARNMCTEADPCVDQQL